MCSSHPLAQEQIDAVDKVLKELDIESIPKLIVWNKVCLFIQRFVLAFSQNHYCSLIIWDNSAWNLEGIIISF